MCRTGTSSNESPSQNHEPEETSAAAQLSEPLLPRPSEPEDERDDESLPPFLKITFYRAIYFLSGLSGSTWGRFGIVYYNEVKHMSPEQIGVLQGVMPLIALVSQPLWGYIADLLQSKKQVFLFCQFLSTISLLSLSLKQVQSFWQVLLCVSGMAIFRASGVLDSHTLDFLGEKHRDLYGSIRLWNAISWGLGCVS